MALTINFTGENKPSTDEAAYFPTIKQIIQASRNNHYDSWDIFRLQEAITTDSKRRIYQLGELEVNPAAYFTNENKNYPTVSWVFSSGSENIFMSNITNSVWSRYFSHDSFELGAGNDRLMLNEISDEWVLWEYDSKTYPTYRDQYLDAGFTLTVSGGPGNDWIKVWQRSDDYVVNKVEDDLEREVFPVVRINGDMGNDQIYVLGYAAIVNGDTPGVIKATGADKITADVFSDWISGGPGPDYIVGSRTDNNPDSSFDIRQREKDLLTGGPGNDTFALNRSYSFNGDNDFVYISDFAAADRISSSYFQGDLLIDPRPGSLILEKTETYAAQTVAYKARIYLDSDGSGKIEPLVDELLAYVNGVVPKQANFIFGDLS